jgi:hypothetical protein
VADAGRGAQLGAERGLAVGSRRDEVEPVARGEQAGAVAGHDVAAPVSKGYRRHHDEDVVGQQGNQRVDVGGTLDVTSPADGGTTLLIEIRSGRGPEASR